MTRDASPSSRLNFAPGSPSRTPGYFRRWSAAICRQRLRDTDVRDLPALARALDAELATTRPRRSVCRALRRRIDTLSIPAACHS